MTEEVNAAEQKKNKNSILWSADSNHLRTAMPLIYYIGAER